LFGQLADVHVVGSARNGREAAEKIEVLRPDLVMLDIQMPERSGLAVAGGLPVEARPEIIFVTAFEMYAPDAFEVEAADYLLKPVRFDRLRQAVERARRRRQMRESAVREAAQAPEPDARGPDEADGFWVQVRDRFVRVPAASIEWIEAAKDYVLLHTAVRSHIHRATMSALEEVLDPQRLLRVHRSAFVSPGRVQKVERLGKGLIALVLKNGVTVPVGPTYARAVLKHLGVADE
jgi:DNA-binding LytR/AlgR family response regulator